MSGVFEAVHFAVMNDAAFLDALVMAASDYFAVKDQDGADGDAAFGEALPCFVDGGLKERVHSRGIFGERRGEDKVWFWGKRARSLIGAERKLKLSLAVWGSNIALYQYDKAT